MTRHARVRLSPLFAALSSLALLGVPGLSGCTDDTAVDDASAGTSETDGETNGDGDGDGDGPIDLVDPEVAWPLLDCDPLVPEHCALPYPNNVYSVDDAATETGRRLALSEAMMPMASDGQSAPDLWSDSDGFTPSSTLMAYFPGVSVTGLPTPETIEASLEPDCPTVLLDAETGARIPHWAELDMSHGDSARRMFMIRPAVRLESDRRYIVAIRGLVDESGALIPASEGFAALRDVSPSDDESVEARRGLYADIFLHLKDAGLTRTDLQLAWDFTTSSDANVTERLVHLRDAGMPMFEAGPQFEITTVELDPAPGLAMRVEGNLIVPLFLDSPNPGGRYNIGADGLPEANGTTSYPFLALIPTSALTEPAGLVQFGHGLFGSYLDVDSGLLRQVAIDYNFVVFGTTWLGMSNGDVAYILGLLQLARLDDFDTVVDRLGQGVFNGLAAMRMMRTTFASAPELSGPEPSHSPPMIDPDRAYYFGASLGGIMGSPYMALTTDVERGILAVPGQPFSLLLNRSEAFVQLGVILQQAFPDRLDVRFGLELMAGLWDRAEPSGFTRHIIDDPLPGTPNHEVFVASAMGDHLVTNYATQIMIRELGIPQLTPVNRSRFDIDEVAGPYEGSAWIEYDFGLPPIPVTNVPMLDGSDPHGALADVPGALLTIEQFLRTGTIESFCDGVCDPE